MCTEITSFSLLNKSSGLENVKGEQKLLDPMKTMVLDQSVPPSIPRPFPGYNLPSEKFYKEAVPQIARSINLNVDYRLGIYIYIGTYI